MITFTFYFLLSFPVTDKVRKILTEKRTTKYPHSEKRLRTKTAFAQSIHDDIANHIELSIANVAHCACITYEVIPNRFKYELDVFCWGPVVKIITKESSINMYTIMRNNMIWVPVHVEHTMDNFTTSELRLFKHRVVNFTVSSNPNRASVILKSETVIIHQDSVIKDGEFLEKTVFGSFLDKLDTKSVVMKQRKSSIRSGMKQAIQKAEVVTWLLTEGDFEPLYEMIEIVSTGETVMANEFIPACSHTQSDGITHYSLADADRLTLRSEGRVNYFTAAVPAEVFFTNPSHSVYHVNCRTFDSLQNFFVFPSVKKLMLPADKIKLNPLVIDIVKVENIPAEELTTQGFRKMFVSYEIPQILHCKTATKPVEKTVRFNNSHMFFTDDVPRVKLIEALDSQSFFAEIYVIKTVENVPNCANIFDKKRTTSKVDIQRVDNDPVLLAVALFNLSSLVGNIWKFREKGQCHQPHMTLTSKPNYEKGKLKDVINMIHLDYPKQDVIIPECTFLELGTTLTLDASLMAPQAPSLVYIQAPRSFLRVFAMFTSEVLALRIYNSIQSHNFNVFEDQNKADQPEEKDILTGFVLDNGTSFVIFVEGLYTGFMLNLVQLLETMCPSPVEGSSICQDERIELSQYKNQKIFFNTDQTFEQRLYENFLPTGIYQMALKIPLQDIMAAPLIHISKSAPKPCLAGLNKLSLLFLANRYKDIMQQNLLPTPQELISVNIEWGVPIVWKDYISLPSF